MESEKRERLPESTGGVKRRAFLQMVGAASGAVVVGGMPARVAAQTSHSPPRGGHLYMQTNESRNAII